MNSLLWILLDEKDKERIREVVRTGVMPIEEEAGVIISGIRDGILSTIRIVRSNNNNNNNKQFIELRQRLSKIIYKNLNQMTRFEIYQLYLNNGNHFVTNSKKPYNNIIKQIQSVQYQIDLRMVNCQEQLDTISIQYNQLRRDLNIHQLVNSSIEIRVRTIENTPKLDVELNMQRDNLRLNYMLSPKLGDFCTKQYIQLLERKLRTLEVMYKLFTICKYYDYTNISADLGRCMMTSIQSIQQSHYLMDHQWLDLQEIVIKQYSNVQLNNH